MLSDEMKVRSNLLAALSSLKETMAITRSARIADRKFLNAIEIAVSRCTDRRDDVPVDEKYVHEILFLVSNAPGSITFLSRRITARLEAAGSPAVALKTLVLLHRLLRGGDRYFEQDLCKLWSSRELRIDLPWCTDTDQLHSFLSKYSLFLEERMGWIINQAGMLEPKARPLEVGSSQEEGAEWLLYRLLKCQSFLDNIMDCLPNSMSSPSQVMQSACNIVLRESIRVYESFRDGMEIMLSSYPEFPKSLTASVLEILKKASSQTPKLCSFYESCKRSSAGKSLDYPFVRIGMSSTQVSALELSPPSSNDHVREGEGEEEEEGVHEDTPFSEKLETTIRTVWVEFEEQYSQSSSRFISVGGFKEYLQGDDSS